MKLGFLANGWENKVRIKRQDVVTLQMYVHEYMYSDLNLLKLNNSQHLDFPAKETRQKVIFTRLRMTEGVVPLD